MKAKEKGLIMKYLDEELSQLRLNETRKEFKNTVTGMYAGDDLITFYQEILFDSQLYIMLPTSFTEMDKNIAQLKYPFKNRPEIIKTNLEGNVNLTFSLLQETMSVEIKQMIESISIILQVGNSSCQFFDKDIFHVYDNTIGWSDFSTSSLNDRIYNIFAIMYLNNNMLLSMFNCPYNRKKEWKPIFLEMLKTMKGKEQ